MDALRRATEHQHTSETGNKMLLLGTTFSAQVTLLALDVAVDNWLELATGLQAMTSNDEHVLRYG